MSKISDFISWLNKQIGSIYVWGAQGEKATESFIRDHETSKTNINRALTLYNKRKSEGKSPILAYDCSGLIVKYFLDNNLISGDTTAAGLYNLCKQITKNDLQAGDLVFCDNGTKVHHVGVYIGSNTVIHAKGRDVGVVKEGIDKNGASYWNKFGRYAKLQDKEVITLAKVITKTSPLMRGDDIKALQTALNSLGYDCGTADGIAGDKTLAAIAEFAAAQGGSSPDSVTVTVKIDNKTYTGTAK